MAYDLDSINFAEALCSRICHDLASPAGGLSAGIEMLGDNSNSNSFDPDLIDLVQKSTKALLSRLRFYRIAFGSSKNLEQSPSRILKDYIDNLNLLRQGRNHIHLIWQEETLDSHLISNRILVLMGLILIDLLPTGGRLEVENTQCSYLFKLSGSHTKLSPDITEILIQQKTPPCTPKNAPLFMIQTFLKEKGHSVGIEEQEEQLCIKYNYFL